MKVSVRRLLAVVVGMAAVVLGSSHAANPVVPGVTVVFKASVAPGGPAALPMTLDVVQDDPPTSPRYSGAGLDQKGIGWFVGGQFFYWDAAAGTHQDFVYLKRTDAFQIDEYVYYGNPPAPDNNGTRTYTVTWKKTTKVGGLGDPEPVQPAATFTVAISLN